METNNEWRTIAGCEQMGFDVSEGNPHKYILRRGTNLDAGYHRRIVGMDDRQIMQDTACQAQDEDEDQ